MQVRRSTPDDIDRIMDVLAEGRTAIATLGIDQWQGDYLKRTQIELDVARGVSYVVEQGGQIAGTAVIDTGGEPTYDYIDGAWLTNSTSRIPTYAVVHRIAVADGYRRQGIASYLLAQAKLQTTKSGLQSLRIDTHPGNLPMRRFIESRGFTYCGVIYLPAELGDGRERVAYELLLSKPVAHSRSNAKPPI